MKKVISVLAALALTLTLSLSMIVFATDINPKTEVSFTVAPTYTVTIPENITLELKKQNDTITYEKDMTITAQNVRLRESSKSVSVYLDSSYKLTDTNPKNTYTLAYTVMAEGTPITDSHTPVAEFTTNPEEQNSTLHFTANDPTYAGNFKDIVTFIISISE